MTEEPPMESRKSQTVGEFDGTSRDMVCCFMTGFHEALYLQAFRER